MYQGNSRTGLLCMAYKRGRAIADTPIGDLITADYRDHGLTQPQLAEKYADSINSPNQKVRNAIVAVVLHEKLDLEERKHLRKRNRFLARKQEQREGQGMFSIESMRKAHENTPLYSDGLKTVMLDGRTFLTDERSYVIMQAEREITNGRIRYGAWRDIAAHTNTVFHNNRTYTKVRCAYNGWKRLEVFCSLDSSLKK